MKRTAFALASLLMFTGISLANYEWYTNSANGHMYALTSHGNWEDCQAEAISQGGLLVTINDPNEHQWLLDESNSLCSSYAIGYPGGMWQNLSWIGLYYEGVGNINSLDSWLWLTGERGSDFLVPAGSFYSYGGIHMQMAGTYHVEYGQITNGPHHDNDPLYYLQGIIEYVPPTVLSPNGNENILSEQIYTITYSCPPEINWLLIEYSLDNGQTWNDIDISENTGFYDWFTPIADFNECLIRISDLFNPLGSDVSDGTFKLYQCQNFFVMDGNEDCYVDIRDFVLLAQEWLQCGNHFDPACIIE